MKRPAFQFYPADWRKDAALQSCSVSAQGLWINILCIAHECEPYGHLTINGKPMNGAQIGRLVGLSPKDCDKLLDELQSAGVLDKTPDNAIFSRRMVRDEDLRNRRAAGGGEGAEHGIKGAEHGSKGGRPKTGTGDKKPPLNPPPSSSSSSSSSNKTPKGAPVGFEEFWNNYPRKDAKPTALKAFAKVKAPLEILLKAIAAQKQSASWTTDQGKFIPMPATWLNNERWNDGVTQMAPELDGETRAAIEKQAFDKGLSAWNPIDEQWPEYKNRVLRAPRIQSMSIDILAAIAKNKQGIPA